MRAKLLSPKKILESHQKQPLRNTRPHVLFAVKHQLCNVHAIQGILTAPRSIRWLTGKAGTGKSMMLRWREVKRRPKRRKRRERHIDRIKT
jgi:hypothetical protein